VSAQNRQSADVPRLLDALGIRYRTHGHELWAPCPHPDHKETRPSWSISHNPQSPGNGSHHCFGCAFNGGPVDLVMAVRGLSMGGSRAWITDNGLWLKGSLPLAVSFEITKLLSNRLRIPSKLLSGPLNAWVTPVRKYALQRGLTDAQCLRWDICYAIDGAMGGRIVFPVKDENEEWLGWHARTFCKQDKRYKNASEADGYDPGAIFGMRHWPPYDARAGLSLVLTEGALDALACERAGARFLAAIGGSEPHARQLLKLQQWDRILVATDGDHAGDRMFETLRGLLGRKVDIRRVEIPRDCDAAELTRDQLRELLWQAEGSGRSPNEARSTSGRVVRRRRVVTLQGNQLTQK